MSEQWGDYGMNVYFDPVSSSFVYSCAWGCFDFDFEGEGEARAAFDKHICAKGKR